MREVIAEATFETIRYIERGRGGEGGTGEGLKFEVYKARGFGRVWLWVLGLRSGSGSGF